MKNITRYRSLDSWLRARHGEKVQKIPLDAGSACPNRDGTLPLADAPSAMPTVPAPGAA